MKIHIDDSCFDLRRRQILRFDGANGLTVVCLRGELWLTQDGDARDVLLGPGERFTLDRVGTALIEALEAGSVRVEAPCKAGAVRTSPDARVWLALAGWLAPTAAPRRLALLRR